MTWSIAVQSTVHTSVEFIQSFELSTGHTKALVVEDMEDDGNKYEESSEDSDSEEEDSSHEEEISDEEVQQDGNEDADSEDVATIIDSADKTWYAGVYRKSRVFARLLDLYLFACKSEAARFKTAVML